MADLEVTFPLSLDTLILYHLNCRLYLPQELIAFQKPYCLLEKYIYISGAMYHKINITKIVYSEDHWHKNATQCAEIIR